MFYNVYRTQTNCISIHYYYLLHFQNYSTSNELLSLEKASSAWLEWESALRELQGALRGDFAALQELQDNGHREDMAAQIKQLAASLLDRKKVRLLN